MLEVFC